MSLREECIALLQEKNYDALVAASRKGQNLFRSLISLTYDKEDVLSWRAIEAIGIISGDMAKNDEAKIRNLAQRLLWMMRDESGNNVGSAPELLGEIVRNSPDKFADIAPIISSFHDEQMLRKGVLFAMARIGEVSPLLFADTPLFFLQEFLHDHDPAIKAYTALLVGVLGIESLMDAIQPMKTDNRKVTVYQNGELVDSSVGQIARETDIILRRMKEA